MTLPNTWSDLEHPIGLELYYSGGWHDVSADLGDDGVTITRGRAAEAIDVDPAEMHCRLKNATGTYSPRNPNSPLYGLIGRNTPIRCWVYDSVGARVYRFWGEVVAWPQRWSTQGSSSAYAGIVCAGIMRRLGTGAAPLWSAYRRGVVATMTDVVAYWPMEDALSASTYASGLAGQPAMVMRGTPATATDGDTFDCSAPLPQVPAGWTAAGTVVAYTATDNIQARVLVGGPEGGVPAETRLLSLTTTGSAYRWEIKVQPAGTLSIDAYDAAGASIASNGPLFSGLNGQALRVSLTLDDDGANVIYRVLVALIIEGATVETYYEWTLTGYQAGAARGLVLAPDKALTGCTIGHATVQKSITSLYELYLHLIAYDGETVRERFQRLATEQGLTWSVVSGDGVTPRIGPQHPAALLDLLRDAAEVDLGILYEDRAGPGLVYRTQESLYSQAPAVSITYTDNLVAMEPVEDDRTTRNVVTVTVADGPAATAEQATGPLSTQAPPAGVGRYEEALTLPLAAAWEVDAHAQWRVHLGTVDEPRWPLIRLDLAHPTIHADTALVDQILALDLGDRLVITDLPDWLPPDPVDQLIDGYTETITPTRYRLELVGRPASPYRVGIWGEADGSGTDSRYSGEGTVLAEDLDTTETGIDVTNPAGIEWTHADGDYDVRADGEVMTVTAVAGTGTAQTLTVTRSVNGVVATHAAGAALDLAEPCYYGL